MIFMFGTIFQVSLLLINAIAILNEERFLARIGWISASRLAQTNPGFQQPYDQSGYAGQDVGIKARMIDLISAVRTLMRIPLIVINTLVILYEVVWG
ncbi:Yos1-like protein [Coprinellus micaceus]|uniref:Yos1-like protein n=1 Tax=Coprinellus micaceus TaxID=71717 RepID=A0A4Y7T827_COPMI|nr:Yos1-like protein [Coprinellus micaceus]